MEREKPGRNTVLPREGAPGKALPGGLIRAYDLASPPTAIGSLSHALIKKRLPFVFIQYIIEQFSKDIAT
ncbi:hypothetical protein BU251_05695 [Candidatus Velamenicoccus archaeovorus]|uniref:Uncharacterized protein n=1 Tax=Velamenicoccus archaeovorus TaxID=1930593 RepID=A0A410P4X0_VELA1|nr:hypothetical protein BU251_05695 [Candidatus Velamenicoccus archaeovorus]